jgi:hypothetical protein
MTDDTRMQIYLSSSSNNRRMSTARIYFTSAGIACIVFLTSLALVHRIASSDTILDDLLFGMIAAALAIAALYRSELRKRESEELRSSTLREIEEQKLRTLKATMVTVQDLIGNFLVSMQYMRSEAEFCMTGETLELFDSLIHEVKAQVKALADVDSVKEKKMAIGTGIDYPAPPSGVDTASSVSTTVN